MVRDAGRPVAGAVVPGALEPGPAEGGVVEPGAVEPGAVEPGGGDPPAGGRVDGTRPTIALFDTPGVVWNDARSARPPTVAMTTVTMRRNAPPQNSKRSK